MGKNRVNLGNLISEELDRFNQIGKYVNGLNEQFLGLSSGGGSGLQVGSRDSELAEQEELPPVDEELPPEEEVTDDSGDETIEEPIEEPTDNTEEIEVTDIVNMTKETGEKTEKLSDNVSKQKDTIDSLISKLDDLEGKLGGMDKIMAAIDGLEDKFEKYRPETPVEKLELRYLDSGPFNQSPKQYWEEKGEKLEKQKDKHEYVLTNDEVDDYTESDIKQSWNYEDEED